MALYASRHVRTASRALGLVLVLACPAQVDDTAAELHVEQDATGRSGAWLQVPQRAEPKTFNPVSAFDTASTDVIGQLHSDLVHIDRRSMQPEPALATSWTISPDGRVYTLNLRRGVRFSDGHPMDADDVVFTFAVYLDSKTHSAQRDLLTISGQPITVSKKGSHTVEFRLPEPYGSALRLFDSVPILPRHLLYAAYREGRIGQAWGLDTPPERIAGLGPFRLKEHVPGQRVILERNPLYWKKDGRGHRLPYLDGVAFHVVPNEEAQIIRFLAGEFSIIDRLSAASYMELRRREASRGVRVYDAGSGLEYQFLVFNLNQPGKQGSQDAAVRHRWFRDLRFRRAVSLAVDRDAIVRLVYRGLADPIWGHVAPGNRIWANRDLPRVPRSVEAARALLRSASFAWRDGALYDSEGNRVAFSILVSSSNTQRAKIATIVQQDLEQLGIKSAVVSLESRSMLDRILNKRDYDAALMALDSGDIDPNSQMNVWRTGGTLRLWNLSGKAGTSWEVEIDRLMTLQMTKLDQNERKSTYDRVQKIIADNLPIICLTSPHVLLAASDRIGNFEPSILRPNALWNADLLYVRER